CIAAVFRKDCLYRTGLLNPNLRGIDDWDLWVRIAERHRVLLLDEPVAIWRTANHGSGQGSSHAARMLRDAGRQQARWFLLPRAAAAPALDRRQARQRFRDSASDWLICDAASQLPL